MKKITLAFILLTFGLQAQTFPSPYCDIANASGVSVEEITSVDFADASITNSDAVSVLVNQTATIANVAPGEIYSIVVTGNTYGNFDTDIVAFIDWNQNDLLDDTGEIFAIGTITNSNGSDGVSVTLPITVPTDAVLGATRIRLTKTYTDSGSPAIVNPCAVEFNAFGMSIQPGFGQALDFTLNLAPLSVDAFELNALSVYPNPTQDVLNIAYKSALKNVKIYNLLGQEVLQQSTNATDFLVDLSSFTSGIYIVKLFTEEGQHSFRIIKE